MTKIILALMPIWLWGLFLFVLIVNNFCQTKIKVSLLTLISLHMRTIMIYYNYKVEKDKKHKGEIKMTNIFTVNQDNKIVSTGAIEWILSEKSGATHYTIAKECEISRSTLSEIKNGKRKIENLTVEVANRLTRYAMKVNGLLMFESDLENLGETLSKFNFDLDMNDDEEMTIDDLNEIEAADIASE